MAPNGSGRIAARSSRRQGRSRSKVVVTWDTDSVDTAHAVDRDLLDQKFIGGERLGLVVVCGGRRNGDVFAHEYPPAQWHWVAIVTAPSATDQGSGTARDVRWPADGRW